MEESESGPHSISSVKYDSPAYYAGVRKGDLVLRINEIDVVGKRYKKTDRILREECKHGRIILEVIEPTKCPVKILVMPQLSTRKSRAIATSSQRSQRDHSRATSADAAVPRSIQSGTSTVRSQRSAGDLYTNGKIKQLVDICVT